ncbi:MAG: sugar transferase [Ruminococcus sp.]|nr:sugar transferase [Ruminococcus sp.]
MYSLFNNAIGHSQEQLELDRKYIQKRSIWIDFNITLKTFKVILKKENM